MSSCFHVILSHPAWLFTAPVRTTEANMARLSNGRECVGRLRQSHSAVPAIMSTIVTQPTAAEM